MIGQQDYGVLMAMTILYAFAVAFLNLVVDVLYAYIDPGSATARSAHDGDRDPVLAAPVSPDREHDRPVA